MITINLLKQSLADIRHIRRRRRLEGLVALLAFVVVGSGLGLVWMDVRQQIQLLEDDLEGKRRLVVAQAGEESMVQSLTDQKAFLMEEALHLEEMQRFRSQSVQILDVVSRILDPLDLWLVAMDFKKGRLDLKGMAKSREDIFRFSQSLGQQTLFQALTISETRAEWIADEPMFSFTFNLQMANDHGGSASS